MRPSIGSEVLWEGTQEGKPTQGLNDAMSLPLLIAVNFSMWSSFSMNTKRPQPDTSHIKTNGEIKPKIFSGKLFTNFEMRWEV